MAHAFIETNVPTAPDAHAAVTKKPPCIEQPQPVKEMRQAGMRNEAQVELPVVGDSTGRLPVAMGRTNTEGHAIAVNVLAARGELIVETLPAKQHRNRTKQVSQGVKPPHLAGHLGHASVKIHDRCYRAYIQAIKEIFLL